MLHQSFGAWVSDPMVCPPTPCERAVKSIEEALTRPYPFGYGLGMSTQPQSWVGEAIAEQEEHLKRERGCGGVPGAPHRFDRFAAEPGKHYEACFACRVTRTPADYAAKLGR